MIKRTFSLLLPLAAIYLLWSYSSTTSPADALARALNMLENQQYSDIEPLLAIAAKDIRVQHWAHLTRGRLLEQLGQANQAIKSYKLVPPTSAASLDRRIALLRLDSTQIDKPVGIEILELEQAIKKANRKDLHGELFYIRALEAEKNEDFILAYSLYMKIREEFIGHRISEVAKSAQYRLTASYADELGINSISSLMSEARLLLRERDFQLALEKIRSIKSRTNASVPAYLDAMVLEEQVLREMGQGEAADNLLMFISADGDILTADYALFRISMNAWNINDHHRALSFIDKLKSRFPKSGLFEEAQYVEARILEELHLLTEAREIYASLGNNSQSIYRKLLSLQRIAWMHLRSGNYTRAAEYFKRSRLIAVANLDGSNLDIRNINFPGLRLSHQSINIEEAYRHSIYWEAYALEQSPDKDFSNSIVELQDKLISNSNPNYYKSLILLSNNKASENEYKDDYSTNPECRAVVSQNFKEVLDILSTSNLRNLAQYEIDWYFSHSISDAKHFGFNYSISPDANLDLDTLKQKITRLELAIKYGNTPLGISGASRLLSFTNSKHHLDNLQTCSANIRRLSFPMPYSEIFKSVTDEYDISLPLLYALVRTESRFDSLAKSRVGALGLAQLMPATAKSEGLKDGQDIFSPEINLRLGAKHLSRLLKSYEGEEIYAIAAYNAGSSAVNRWLTRYPNLPPHLWVELIGYPETKNYVKSIVTAKLEYERALLSTRDYSDASL
jgi:hypothetical protein